MPKAYTVCVTLQKYIDSIEKRLEEADVCSHAKEAINILERAKMEAEKYRKKTKSFSVEKSTAYLLGNFAYTYASCISDKWVELVDRVEQLSDETYAEQYAKYESEKGLWREAIERSKHCYRMSSNREDENIEKALSAVKVEEQKAEKKLEKLEEIFRYRVNVKKDEREEKVERKISILTEEKEESSMNLSEDAENAFFHISSDPASEIMRHFPDEKERKSLDFLFSPLSSYSLFDPPYPLRTVPFPSATYEPGEDAESELKKLNVPFSSVTLRSES